MKSYDELAKMIDQIVASGTNIPGINVAQLQTVKETVKVDIAALEAKPDEDAAKPDPVKKAAHAYGSWSKNTPQDR